MTDLNNKVLAGQLSISRMSGIRNSVEISCIYGYRPFVSSQMAKEGLVEVDSMLEYVEKLRNDLAEYFCEDASTFKLEECITTFKVFCEKFKKAITVSASVSFLCKECIQYF